ncbi:ABC transporter permease [Martelella sp. HB161492]|uniref:ABC transporter permease n=1 Tax=Martelella sp. HB161492 TaxID=2720726 RepID=UPI0015900538|nr:ABC transporter permease [Martelella sp. HB161492]
MTKENDSSKRNAPTARNDGLLKGLRHEIADLGDGIVEAAKWVGRRPLHVWLRAGVLIAAWFIWSLTAAHLPRGFFTTPTETARALADMLQDFRQLYLRAIVNTLYVYWTGLLISALIGIPLGLFLAAVPLMGRTFTPYVNALAATPLIALMPMVILIFGLGDGSKILIVTLGAIMPVIINSYAGLRNADPKLDEMARAYGFSRIALWRHVRLPAAFPVIMAGLRLGATTGLVTAVVADIYMAMTGLGALLIAYGNSFLMGNYLIVMLTLAAIGVGTTALLSAIERLLTPKPVRRRLYS